METSFVISARMMKLGKGGKAAQRELDLMISEKVLACSQLQTKLLGMGAAAEPSAKLDVTLRHFNKKVTANRRRLSR